MADKPLAADDAINAALAAESAAADAIRRCEKEAERLVGEARDTAYRLAERTDQRITSLHARCRTTVRTQAEALLKRGGEAEVRASVAESGGTERLIGQAAERLAAQLTTPEHREKELQSS